ncbi:MAG: hypothetical protein JO022_06445 [Acidobacteriaceae bacterium]|nr:hypothetical protein [Acidobacteriaceae bacterium]
MLVSVPEEAVQATIAEMASAEVSWAGRLVVLWSRESGVEALDPLMQLGAEGASLCLVPGFDEDWFLLEGSKGLEHRLRPLLGGRGVRVLVVGAREKTNCMRRLTAMTREFWGLLRETAEGLRRAGVSNRDVESALERQVQMTLRSCFRSGRMGRGASARGGRADVG